MLLKRVLAILAFIICWGFCQAQSHTFSLQCDSCQQSDYYITDWKTLAESGLYRCFKQDSAGFWVNRKSPYEKPNYHWLRMDTTLPVMVFNIQPYGQTIILHKDTFGKNYALALLPNDTGALYFAPLPGTKGSVKLFQYGVNYFFWVTGPQKDWVSLIPIYEFGSRYEEYNAYKQVFDKAGHLQIFTEAIRLSKGYLCFEARYLYPNGALGPMMEEVKIFQSDKSRYTPWFGIPNFLPESYKFSSK